MIYKLLGSCLGSTSEFTQEQIRQEIERDRRAKEIADEMRTNRRYKEFFDKYEPGSVEKFI